MVNAINAAITANTDGIGTTLINGSAFNSPVQAAINANIPVVSYYVDAPSNPRLAYIGQDRFAAGVALGERIAGSIHKGQVAVFVANRHSAEFAPRLRGRTESFSAPNRRIKLKVVTTGSTTAQQTKVARSFVGLNQAYRGFYGLDADSTQAVGAAVKRYYLSQRGTKAGGFDITPAIARLINGGTLEFAIDQQPYLQGFLVILQLYMYKVSDGLTGVADTDTGLRFIDKTAVEPFAQARSVFEGTSRLAGIQAS